MKTDIDHLTGSQYASALKAARSFPERLRLLHEGRVVLTDRSVYKGMHKTVHVACTVCGHEWSAKPNNLICNKTGCPECKRLKDVERAGGTRQHRASKAEKELAMCCRKAGMTLESIGDLMNRSSQTIQRWTDPVADERHKKRNNKRNALQSASGIKQQRDAAYLQTPHGKANKAKGRHKRRALQYHALDRILVDGVWHDVDMWEYITTAADRDRWSFDGADDDVAKRKSQQILLGKISGEIYTLDHLVPLNQGGIHHPSNFQNLASALNSSKCDSIVSKDVELFCKRLFN